MLGEFSAGRTAANPPPVDLRFPTKTRTFLSTRGKAQLHSTFSQNTEGKVVSFDSSGSRENT